jgi:Flp pilus assembly protein TadB
MNNTQNGNSNNSGNGELYAIGLFAICAVVVEKQAIIKFWFYQNLMMLVLGAFVIIALFVTYKLNRMKKKYSNELGRNRAIEKLSAKSDIHSYYEKGDK